MPDPYLFPADSRVLLRVLQLIIQHACLSFLSVSLQVPSKLRLAALLGILRSSCRPGQPGKTVVFMSSCDSVEFHYMLLTTLAEELVEDGQPLLACAVFMLHGNMPQVMPLAAVWVWSAAKQVHSPVGT